MFTKSNFKFTRQMLTPELLTLLNDSLTNPLTKTKKQKSTLNGKQCLINGFHIELSCTLQPDTTDHHSESPQMTLKFPMNIHQDPKLSI